MYHVFYAVILASSMGLLACAGLVRRPLPILAAFWAGQFFNVLMLYLTKRMATSMGWYMYAAAGAEVVVCLAGLRAILPGRAKRWVPFDGVALFALLDLYTVQVAAPYYAGLTRHRAGGSPMAWHGAGVAELMPRLSEFNPFPPAMLAGLWLACVLATLVLVIVSAPRAPD
jgi:hypothetical protein